jgi:hypothetical protein
MATAILLALMAVAPAAPIAGAGEEGPERTSPRVAPGTERGAKKPPRRAGRAELPRLTPPIHPVVTTIAHPSSVAVGERFTVTVRMYGGGPAARYAAFGIGVDPSKARYVGSAPTGRGALMVKAREGVDGELGVYRSSLPEGFASTETLVEMEFEAVAAGPCSIVLLDPRVLDARARDIAPRGESGSVDVQ